MCQVNELVCSETSLKAHGCRDGCFRLQHVRVDELLEGDTLGLLLHGTLVVGYSHPDAESHGWKTDDQIVEVNGDHFSWLYGIFAESSSTAFAACRCVSFFSFCFVCVRFGWAEWQGEPRFQPFTKIHSNQGAPHPNQHPR